MNMVTLLILSFFSAVMFYVNSCFLVNVKAYRIKITKGRYLLIFFTLNAVTPVICVFFAFSKDTLLLNSQLLFNFR